MFVTLFYPLYLKTVIDEKNISTTRSAVILTLLSIVLSAFIIPPLRRIAVQKE